jgi:hypothetical protein
MNLIGSESAPNQKVGSGFETAFALKAYPHTKLQEKVNWGHILCKLWTHIKKGILQSKKLHVKIVLHHVMTARTQFQRKDVTSNFCKCFNADRTNLEPHRATFLIWKDCTIFGSSIRNPPPSPTTI